MKASESAEDKNPLRITLSILLAVLVLGLTATVVYRGISGLEGRGRPRAEDFSNAVKPQFRPDDYGVVVEVYDGDTVRLADGRRIRYLGIDTPETAKPHLGMTAGEPFADEATEFNREWVMGREVGLIYGTQRIDRYGRILAYVIVDDTCVNTEILRHGLARLFIPKYFKFKQWFLKAQDEARRRKWGIWSRS